MTVCAECGKEFTPNKHAPHREICFNPECKAAREAKWNRSKADKKSALRQAKRWKAHQRTVHGIGKGNASKIHSGLFRKCLDCRREFEVPPDTDDRMCAACHAKHDRLLAECDEEALGVSDSSISYGSLGNGGRREPCHREGLS